MWFPIDFFFHEIVGLFPETVLYYSFKTGIMALSAWSALLVYEAMRRRNRSIFQLALLTGITGAAAFGAFYDVLYYTPFFLPTYSPSSVLVTNLIGLHYAPLALSWAVLYEFAVIHFGSNTFGSFLSAAILLRGHRGFSKHIFRI